MSGPEHQVAEIAAKIAKEKYNLDVEFVELETNIRCQPAVSKGDLRH